MGRSVLSINRHVLFHKSINFCLSVASQRLHVFKTLAIGTNEKREYCTKNVSNVFPYMEFQDFPVNPRDAKCRTPLLLASAVGGLESVKVLLEFSAEVTVKDFNLRSALHLAIGHNMTLEALLKVNIIV